MLNHPYSFLQSARAHCKAVSGYQGANPALKQELDRLGQFVFPPKEAPLSEYSSLVQEYLHFLQECSKEVVRLRFALSLQGKEVKHLDKRLREIDKCLTYHFSH